MAWHQHILDTNNYTNMCQTIVGHYSHHSPALNDEDSGRCAFVYQKTLCRYQMMFRSEPPSDIWTPDPLTKIVPKKND